MNLRAEEHYLEKLAASSEMKKKNAWHASRLMKVDIRQVNHKIGNTDD